MSSEQLVLTQEMTQGIEASLRKFIRDSSARCALLITRSGQLVGQVGFTSHLNVLSLCALVAGIFTTTQELARLIGESKFKSLFQEGKSWNLHFTLVSEDLIFATLFDKRTVIGAVQLSASEASERIAGLLVELAVMPPAGPVTEIEVVKREVAPPVAPQEQSVLRPAAQAFAPPPLPAAPPTPQVLQAPPPSSEEKKEEKPPGPKNQLAPDFEESAAAALDKLFDL